MTILQAFSKALRQMREPELLRFVWKSMAVFLIIIVTISALTYGILTSVTFFQKSWLESLVAVGGSFLVLISLFFFSPAIVAGLSGIFSDDIAAITENKSYPNLPKAVNLSLHTQIGMGLKFFLIVVGLNFLALPFVFFIPFVLLFLNGYLLGREYFETVALRRLSQAEVQRLHKKNFWTLWLCGLLIAFLSIIPILNFFAPIIATIFMVHVVQSFKEEGTIPA